MKLAREMVLFIGCDLYSKVRSVSAPGTLPHSFVVILGDDVVLLKPCDSAMVFFEPKMLSGEPLLHPSTRGTENEASFGFWRAKVELVNHCKPVSYSAGHFGLVDELRSPKRRDPGLAIMPMLITVVVASFFCTEASGTDKLESI